jgi:hypothetical protein
LPETSGFGQSARGVRQPSAPLYRINAGAIGGGQLGSPMQSSILRTGKSSNLHHPLPHPFENRGYKVYIFPTVNHIFSLLIRTFFFD